MGNPLPFLTFNYANASRRRRGEGVGGEEGGGGPSGGGSQIEMPDEDEHSPLVSLLESKASTIKV